jgi:hypothetical protein
MPSDPATRATPSRRRHPQRRRPPRLRPHRTAVPRPTAGRRHLRPGARTVTPLLGSPPHSARCRCCGPPSTPPSSAATTAPAGPARSAIHVRRPSRARTGAMSRSRRWRQAAPTDGESSDWTIGYPPVVRRARVGLLPSRSGRVTMYAAASPGRPRSPFAPGCPSVLRCQAAGKLRRRRPATQPTDGGDRRGDRHRERSRGSHAVGVRARSSGGLPGTWQCVRRARLSARRLGVRPNRAEVGVKEGLETVADGLTAPSTRVPDAERPSLCR